MELQLKLQLESAVARLQEAQKEASELKAQVEKQAEELIELREKSKRTASLERQTPNTEHSHRLAFELQSNPTFQHKILSLRTTLQAKSPTVLNNSGHLFKRPTALAHRSNPASPYRDMHPSRARLSPVTERRHLRVASDRTTKSTRLRTGLRH